MFVSPMEKCSVRHWLLLGFQGPRLTRVGLGQDRLVSFRGALKDLLGGDAPESLLVPSILACLIRQSVTSGPKR